MECVDERAGDTADAIGQGAADQENDDDGEDGDRDIGPAAGSELCGVGMLPWSVFHSVS